MDEIFAEAGEKNVDIMYDVGCRFDKTLKVVLPFIYYQKY